MKKRWIFLTLGASMLIAFNWKNPQISGFFHKAIDPVLLPLLNWNIFWGMTLLVLIMTLIMTFVQKYTTDQDTLRSIKKDQKIIQADMKKFKDHPEKMMEFNKLQMELTMKMFKLSMGSIVYTAVPFVLLFQWFNDFYAANPFVFLGFMTWFWFYLIGSIVMSSIFRKVFDVA